MKVARGTYQLAQYLAAEDALASAQEAEAVAVDVTHPDSVRAMVEHASKRFGRIDVLVNAGASTARGTIVDTTPETFDELFSTNVRGPYFLMQEAIKVMIAKGIEGAICNIGSISALAGQPFINA